MTRRPFWTLSRREARGHAVVLAAVLWVWAGVLWFATPGYVDLLGGLKGPDFVHFYTLGSAVRLGAPELLYDARGLHALQTMLVPEAADSMFLPVYGPQTALVFAPVAFLSYGWAFALWVCVIGATYLGTVHSVRRTYPDAFADRVLLFAAAAGFPPFWNLVLHGQSTPVPLLGFGLGWLALGRGREFLAGVALGLVAIKPQLGLVLAVIVIAGGHWRLMAGAITSVGLQGALSAAVLGPESLTAYAYAISGALSQSAALEPRPYQLHSIRAVTQLLPSPADTALWAMLSALVAWRTVAFWRGSAPLGARYAVVVLASVLVSPHLTIYDATILVLPLMLIGGWLETEGDPRRGRYWGLVYLLVVSFIVPVALMTGAQVSVGLQLWLFAIVSATPKVAR